MALQTAEIVLRARGRFDLRATVLSYGYYQLPPYRWDDAARTLARAEEASDGRVHLLLIRPAPRGVAVRITGPGAADGAAVASLAARVRTALRLDDDPREFHRLCRSRPELCHIARLGLARMLRGTSLFEDLVKAIAWTNTTWPAAVSMIGRLGALGRPCPARRDLRAFPSAARLARVGEAALRARTGLGYRARYLVELSRAVHAGALDLDGLEARARELTSPAVARELCAIRGVGPGTAAWILMMLGHYDQPVIDRATLRWATTALYRGRRPTEARLRRRAARYGRWQALALWFMQCVATGHTPIAHRA